MSPILISFSNSGQPSWETERRLTCCMLIFFFGSLQIKKKPKDVVHFFFTFLWNFFFYFITFLWVIFFPETIILSSAKVNMHCDIGPETSPIASTPLYYKSHDAMVFKRFGDGCLHVTHIMSLNMHIRMNKKLPKFIFFCSIMM